MFIPNGDIEKLPASMLINHDSTNYRIFMSDDTVTFFLCKEKVHTSTSIPINENKNDTSEKSLNTSIMVTDVGTNKYTPSPKINKPPQITYAKESYHNNT